MKARLTGALVVLALVAGVVLVRLRPAPLRADEAVARIPFVEGVQVGTPVTLLGGGGNFGHVRRVERRQDDLVLRLRFDDTSRFVRRRGDAIMLVGVRGEKRIVIYRGPIYENAASPSDTLLVVARGERRPASVQKLLESLHRPGGPPWRDSSVRR